MDETLKQLLVDVAEVRGPYSSDPYQHARNCLENFSERAKEILAAAGIDPEKEPEGCMRGPS